MRCVECLERRRLLAVAGELDSTFGMGGIVTPADQRTLQELVALPNDELLARYAQGTTLRFSDDGSLISTVQLEESSFSPSSPSFPLAEGGMLTQASQTTYEEETGQASTTDGILKYKADGKIDRSFGANGFGDVPSASFLRFTVQSDGKAIVWADGRLCRLTADGESDSSFQIDEADFNNTFETQSIHVQQDGKILLFGSRIREGLLADISLLRLNPDGTIDKSFGGGAPVFLSDRGSDQTIANDAIPLANGRVAVPFISTVGKMILRVYTNNGELDPSFATGGEATIKFGNFRDRYFDVTCDSLPDGRLFLRASAVNLKINETKYAVALLSSDGSLDPSFSRITSDSLQLQGVITSSGKFAFGDSAALYRMNIDGDEPLPVTLDAGQLSIVGRETADDLLVKRSGKELVVSASRSPSLDRLFFAADVEEIHVDAKAGDDVVRINAGTIPATIIGGAGNDRVRGGNGRDSLYGNAGKDRIDGGSGSDLISGGGGNDVLRGMSGADRLYGGSGNDKIEGDGAADRLTGGDDPDLLFGNGGDDLFFSTDASIDSLFGNNGHDKHMADANDVLVSVESAA